MLRENVRADPVLPERRRSALARFDQCARLQPVERLQEAHGDKFKEEGGGSVSP